MRRLLAKSLSLPLSAELPAVSSPSSSSCTWLTFIDVAPEILQNTKHRRYTRAVDVWSLGVVLYICLCGFPPFSDELYTRENPYTMAQQIKMGRFDYPSPYWDPIGDPALDLIDRMLTVDAEKRLTIDECLEHPWTRNVGSGHINPADSTDGLTGAMNGLDFSKRKVQRERTLLAEINDIKVSKVVKINPKSAPGNPPQGLKEVKVWEKNPDGKVAMAPSDANKDVKKSAKHKGQQNGHREEHPAVGRQEEEFMNMGGKGDMQLFANDASSRYLPDEVPP